MTLKNALSARHYAVIDKIMAKLDHESQVDPRYESLYVAILTSVTTCKKLSGAIQRSLLDYESSEPKSPWAHLLLGRYYDASACHARGEGWAKDVKKSQWKAMYNFDRQAVAEYLDALRINDRLFPAYDGLMRILMDIGNLHEITSIYKRSRKFLPKSDILAEIYMNALKPRWHGNYRLMRQFANSMQQHLDQNPRFYNLRGAVDADKANLAYLNHQDGYALTEYTIALLYGDNPDWLKTAGYAAADTGMYRIASTYLGRYLFYKPQDLNIKKLLGKLKHDCASQPTTASCQEKLPSFVKEETLSELRGSH